jgi:hypothetical protein
MVSYIINIIWGIKRVRCRITLYYATYSDVLLIVITSISRRTRSLYGVVGRGWGRTLKRYFLAPLLGNQTATNTILQFFGLLRSCYLFFLNDPGLGKDKFIRMKITSFYKVLNFMNEMLKCTWNITFCLSIRLAYLLVY